MVKDTVYTGFTTNYQVVKSQFTQKYRLMFVKDIFRHLNVCPWQGSNLMGTHNIFIFIGNEKNEASVS